MISIILLLFSTEYSKHSRDIASARLSDTQLGVPVITALLQGLLCVYLFKYQQLMSLIYSFKNRRPLWRDKQFGSTKAERYWIYFFPFVFLFKNLNAKKNEPRSTRCLYFLLIYFFLLRFQAPTNKPLTSPTKRPSFTLLLIFTIAQFFIIYIFYISWALHSNIHTRLIKS